MLVTVVCASGMLLFLVCDSQRQLVNLAITTSLRDFFFNGTILVKIGKLREVTLDSTVKAICVPFMHFKNTVGFKRQI